MLTASHYLTLRPNNSSFVNWHLQSVDSLTSSPSDTHRRWIRRRQSNAQPESRLIPRALPDLPDCAAGTPEYSVQCHNAALECLGCYWVRPKNCDGVRYYEGELVGKVLIIQSIQSHFTSELDTPYELRSELEDEGWVRSSGRMVKSELERGRVT